MATTATSELAACLRSCRERVGPSDVGLVAGGQRRVRGLRREELAHLAGVSMDYLTRLEQGRALHPSASVLGALARALRLSDIERDHLFRLADQPPPGPGAIATHIPASVQRLMDRLTDVPVLITTAAREIIAANLLAQALFPEASAPSRRERTLAWRRFMGLHSSRVLTADELGDDEAILVAELQTALSRYPADDYLAALVSDLRGDSVRFEQLWTSHELAGRHAHQKRFRHPQVGPLTLDCDDLSVDGSDLHIVVFTAAPRSPSEEALALLGAIGLQRFGVEHCS
ncbi:helix-turn-helix transcriptional regulator [Acidiferrimicrobium sp. IK]|uniref:helix-turn-helix transcriptional regulator n=1 Tax=Acidiferrimicrobium sp. IK TaxID=2871700 RepID=UPI0021CB0CE9|nr:helix-turn-helix transcriptional regulator [Acidiferrimicrobium sp. IK]MCU4185532.1 helix-turn-helix transcriptional regulator [Acidiferrimicrobium sp. IK]